MLAAVAPRALRFGEFVVDVRGRTLSKRGIRLKLHGQPFEILLLLLEHPGEVVTREELQKRLWADNAFVDFEDGLNTAIRKLRQTLGDSAEGPRYVETVPRVGYRFIAPLEMAPDQAASKGETSAHGALALTRSVPAASNRSSASHSSLTLVRGFAVAVFVFVGTALALNSARTRDRLLGLLRSTRPSAASAISLVRARHSIAVLPLEDLSGDPQQDYFAEGMTDELTTGLAQFKDLRVISRTSATHYKGTNKTSLQIGKELGVDTLIEGTVERVGEHVRIRAQLIDCISDRHLWAKSYDREFKNVLALESELARDIVEQTQGNVLSTQSLTRPADPRPVNPNAYEAYLKGRYFWNKRTHEGFMRAVEYFRAAIDKDPTYAQAFAGLADSYVLLGGYGFEEQKDAMSKAKSAALKALAIDDRLAEAYTSLGLIEQFDWNWADAEKDFKRAIELNANYSVAHHWYGDGYLAAVGKSGETIAELRKAHELDPLSLVIATDLAKRLCYAGNYEEGMEQFQKVLEVDPDFVQAHHYLSQAYEMKGLFPEAIAEARKIKPPDAVPYAIGRLGHIYALQGRRSEALGIVDQLQRVSSQTHNNDYYIIPIYIALGERDLAFVWLERGYQLHSYWMGGLKTDPVYSDTIRSDPRFQDLVRRVGLTH